ncbi:hypothetical protein HMPREF0742_00241 [Rothia aeria F0184]|uniref:Uncharacterized protein n=1 Tax=Rothia aeria F0184 TaxID=888019 RepID=U7V756_9MICC|nr:hypothetical protein HMPREF0742_00241 [Rothia aeria F0184]
MAGVWISCGGTAKNVRSCGFFEHEKIDAPHHLGVKKISNTTCSINTRFG